MRDDRPKYRAIYEELRADLGGGKYRIGETLPPIEELTDRYGVAMNTVRNAQRLLIEEGLVRSEQGRGVFVVALPAPRNASVGDLVRPKLSEAIRLLTEVQATLGGASA